MASPFLLASWAIVTGGTSGIGREIVERLAQQGLNIIIAAVDNPDLVRNFSLSFHCHFFFM